MPRYRAEPTLSDSRTRQKSKKKVSSVMLLVLAYLIYFVEQEPPITIGAGADPLIIFKGFFPE